MIYARCPQCDLPANIVDRFSLTGTDGPVNHVKTVCVAGHWFTPTVDEVEMFSAPVPQAAPADAVGAR
jgi:hypothetical protein